MRSHGCPAYTKCTVCSKKTDDCVVCDGCKVVVCGEHQSLKVCPACWRIGEEVKTSTAASIDGMEHETLKVVAASGVERKALLWLAWRAKEIGADAVVSVHLSEDRSTFTGTAVKLKPKR